MSEYEKEIDALCLTFAKNSGGSLKNILNFLQPEIRAKAERLKRLLAKSSTKNSIILPLEMMRTLTGVNNLSKWSTSHNLTYDSGFKFLIAMAALGYVNRKEPTTNRRGISFNFSLSDEGKKFVGVAMEPVLPRPKPPATVTPATPAKKADQLQEALRMLMEVAREEDPNVSTIQINLTTGEVKMERKSVVFFTL